MIMPPWPQGALTAVPPVATGGKRLSDGALSGSYNTSMVTDGKDLCVMTHPKETSSRETRKGSLDFKDRNFRKISK